MASLLRAAASDFEPFWTRIWSWVMAIGDRYCKAAILYSQRPPHPAGELGDILRDLLAIRP